MVVRAGAFVLWLMAALSILACEQDRQHTDQPDALTLADFVARLEAAMTRADAVFHVVAAMTAVAPEQPPFHLGTTETWLDLQRGAFRQEWRKDPAWRADYAERTWAVFAGGVLYRGAPGERPLKLREHRCPALALVVAASSITAPCVAVPIGVTPRVETGGEYEGTPAVALVYEWQMEGVAGRPPYDKRLSLFVSRDWFLPRSCLPRRHRGRRRYPIRHLLPWRR